MNNMQPFFYPNQMNQFEGNYNMEIRNLEERIYNLEKEINKLRNKITKLENSPISTDNDLYTNNYQPNTYNMM